jgi:hypothetical protein
MLIFFGMSFSCLDYANTAAMKSFHAAARKPAACFCFAAAR